MQSRRFTFGNDRPLRDEMDSIMTDDFDDMRKRFNDRARNMRQETSSDFDRMREQWFDRSEDSAFQPRFKIPKEDERSSYVRNIPIFTADDLDTERNLMRQGSTAIPKPVPPQNPTATRTQSQFTPTDPTNLPPRTKPTVQAFPSNASDSGIERGASGSPSDISDAASSASWPRFRSNTDNASHPTKTSGKEKAVPIKVETGGAKPEQPIPMGYLPKGRNPAEPIPMGYDRPASAPNEAHPKTDSPKVPRATAPPETGSSKVHRVPIVVKPLDTPRSASAPPKRTEASPPPASNAPAPASAASAAPQKVKTPLEKIEDVISDVQKLESRINGFKGSRRDHEYRLLDELLTQSVLKLDVITTEGLDEVRNARKKAVKRVHDAICLLESRAVESEKNSPPKDTPPAPVGPHRTVIALNPEGEKQENKSKVDKPGAAKETMID